jgi:hypothetical protein
MMTRLVVRQSSTIAKFVHAVRRRFGEWLRRRTLNDATTLSSFVLTSTVVMLTVACWYFYPMIEACLSGRSIANAPREQLALFSPALWDSYHTHYREAFTFVILLAAVSWHAVLKLAAREGQTVGRGMLFGGAAVIVLALAALDLPYRMLRHSEFAAAKWNGEACYIIGEREADMLLFCPELPDHRNRIVAKGNGTVERLGVRESIFTRFSPSAWTVGRKETP